MKNTFLKIVFIITAFSLNLLALEKVTLNLKWFHQFQFAGYYIAKEKGFYEDVGLDVKIEQRDIKENYIEKIMEKEAYYGIADSIILLYKSRDNPIILLSTVFQHSPNILISLKNNVDSPYKLNNKKILFYEKDIDGFSILALLKKLNINPNLIRKIGNKAYTELLNDTVDAIPAYISNEPYYFKKRNIPIHIINPANYGFDFYGDMIFTSRKEAINHPLRAEKFKEASLKGWKYALKHKEEVIKLIHDKYAKNISIEHLRFEANAIDKLISMDTTPLGTLDEGRLKYINNFLKEYSNKKINNLNLEKFLFKGNKNFFNFSKEELKYLKEHPTLNVQSLKDFPPFNFIENNVPKGFLIDYFNYVTNLTGIKFNFKRSLSWDKYQEMIRNKEVDIIPNIAITNKRKKFITYSDFSHIRYTPAIVSNKNAQSIHNIKEISDSNKIIAILNSSFLQKVLKNQYPELNLLAVSSSQKAIEMVLENRADFAIGNISTLNYIIQKNWYTNLKTTKLQSKYIPSYINLHMGYEKGNEILKSIFEKIDKKIPSSKIDMLLNKWSKIDTEKTRFKLTNEEKLYLLKKKKINFCIDPEWMPFEKIKDNKVFGMTSEYINYFEEKLNIPFNLIKTKDWTQTLEFLKKRKCDLSPAIINEKERRDYLDFTKKYLTYPLVLATRLEEQFINNLPSAYDKKVGYIKNYAYINALKNKYPKIKFVEVKSIKDGLQKVKNKKIFGFAEILPTIGYYIQKDYFGELKVSGKFNNNWGYSIGTRNDEPLLHSIMNKVISNISKQKQENFYKDWISVKYEDTIDYKKVIIISSILLVIIIIISLKNRTIHKINVKMQKYIDIIDNHVIISSTDTKGNITYVSKAFLDISQYTKEELIGKNHNIVRHPDTNNSLFEDLWRTIKSGKEWRGEIKNKKKDGGYFWTYSVITPEYDEKGKIKAYTAIRENITDKKRIEEISITDGLTNIYNRRYFNDVLPTFINNAKRYDEIFTFVIMDIDYFKQYNDNYGHQKGDYALIQISTLLKEYMRRADDYAFRLGGEEFGLLYKSKNISSAKEFAKDIIFAIENLKIIHEHSNTSKYITVSAGASCQHAKDSQDIETLYKQTDELLYKAKESGRNKIIFNQ
ncbi:diguanylate cyclase domain-containing protein [Arcobacter sp. CECT 8985]|uniref:diguanylate cyclase domain-containing protein n=1 Tax=Arcobacter sp. CECT 8985 TaxID=1935424 RepID=UPI00100B93A7|nr:transporter substrate-binding domain-containing protein [Arcobacter sp. CECT 8985]RXJ86758.1 hypothetical protein CRU93_07385 [Arcobacter sp. CECT 8985]